MKWLLIIIVALTLCLNGCAKDATAEDSPTTTPTETSTETKTNSTSSDKEWIAVILEWNPVNYTIDKEFTSEVECWNYYDTGVGESKMLNSYGTQVLDHQGNKPDKEYMKKNRLSHREYPTRMYKNNGDWMVWLTCDLRSRHENL